MKLLMNGQIKTKKWEAFLVGNPFASPFQTPKFYDFFNSVYGYSANVFAIEENNEYKSLSVVAIQKEPGIKSYFSRRGIIYGGPLLKSFSDQYLFELLNAINLYYRKKIIYLEIRNNHDYSILTHVYKTSGWAYIEHLNIQLNVENKTVADILGGMKYNRRREINLSYKEGANVRLAREETEIVALFEILKNIYKKSVKLPLPPLSYFVNLYKSNIGKAFVVIHNNRIIGGAICVYSENMSIYTNYYAGLKDYHKKIFPTHLAIMGVIEFAINNNLKIVDFMGAGKPNKEYGVRNFKLQFGGELVEHGRYINILSPTFYQLGQLGLSILSKI